MIGLGISKAEVFPVALFSQLFRRYRFLGGGYEILAVILEPIEVDKPGVCTIIYANVNQKGIIYA
jgi:hypothetical protein